MKKLIIILSLILTSLVCSAQFTKDGSIEIGYENRMINIYNLELSNDWLLKQYQVRDMYNCFFGTLSYGIGYKGFKLYTDVKTYFKYVDIKKYSPEIMIYTIGGSYTYRKLQLKYEHMCTHSVDVLRYKESYDIISLKLAL